MLHSFGYNLHYYKVLTLIMNNKNEKQAIIYMLVSSFSFAFMQFFVKISASNVDIMVQVFSRNLLTLLISAILMIKAKESFAPQKENIKWLLLRSLSGFVGVYAFFYATKHIYLADAAILQRLSPVFIMIFSAIFLNIKFTKVGIISLVLAIVGSLFVIRPHFNSSIIPSLIAFSSAIFGAIAYTTVSFMNGRESANLIVFYFSLISSIISMPFAFSEFHLLKTNDIMILSSISIAAALGQIFITLSYKNGNPNTVSVFGYIGIVLSFILGVTFLKESINIYSIIGIIFILCGAFVTYKWKA